MLKNTLGDSLLGLWLGTNLGLDPTLGLDPVTAPLKRAKSCDSATVLTNILGDRVLRLGLDRNLGLDPNLGFDPATAPISFRRFPSELCSVDVLFKLFTA